MTSTTHSSHKFMYGQRCAVCACHACASDNLELLTITETVTLSNRFQDIILV